MGLGKTLTTLSLIVSARERAVHFQQQAFGSTTETDLPHSRAALVVVPSTQMMDSWVKQVHLHTSEASLNFSRYHGHERARHWTDLRDQDIILTTYGTIATEYRRPRRQVLYCMRFYRIVLDEAHIIRTRRTKLFEAIKKLEASHHWCLTGTPISNRIEDLGSLLDFCRVPILGEHAEFQKHVAIPVKQAVGRSCSALREVLKPICLRRTKALLNIAEPSAVEKVVTFSPAEQARYHQILKMGKVAIDDALRIFCNQGTYMTLADGDTEQSLDADEHRTLLEETEEAFCVVCASAISGVNQVDDPSSGVLGACSHMVCAACRDEVVVVAAATLTYKCPVCDGTASLHSTPDHRPVATQDPGAQHSTKLEALVQDLLLSQHEAAAEKSIVFSAWRKTIGLAADMCRHKGIRAVHIDGTTPHAERSGILDRFAHDPTVSTLLMTVGTGGLGLTITAASRVHILEPQWNPSVEDQAIGRVVRLGQARATTVIRYIVKDSVEQHVQGYQKRKIKLAAGGFDHCVNSSMPKGHERLDTAFLARPQT